MPLIDIVMADENDAPAIGSSISPLETFPGIAAKHIDQVKLAKLAVILNGHVLNTQAVLEMVRTFTMLHDDAHDAFQATFLVLARKARSVRRPESVGCWLHGVAQRISARTGSNPRDGEPTSGERARLTPDHSLDGDGCEIDPSLHEEVERLPEKCRAPIVLCYLESLTHEEAAAHLGWPVGTVRGRLARARLAPHTAHPAGPGRRGRSGFGLEGPGGGRRIRRAP